MYAKRVERRVLRIITFIPTLRGKSLCRHSVDCSSGYASVLVPMYWWCLNQDKNRIIYTNNGPECKLRQTLIRSNLLFINKHTLKPSTKAQVNTHSSKRDFGSFNHSPLRLICLIFDLFPDPHSFVRERWYSN